MEESGFTNSIREILREDISAHRLRRENSNGLLKGQKMEMRKMKAKMVLSVLALAALVLCSLTGYAGKLKPSGSPALTMKTLDEVEPRIPIQSLPGSASAKYVINRPGSYCFRGDVVVLAMNEHGIAVEVNDVTINLKGYCFIGPGSGTSYGIYYERT